MSRLNLTNQSVLEPISYEKEQGSILKEPLLLGRMSRIL
ncbi:hypothetical protein LEP1GSC036_0916 [Leptospira weilii str. 2006001853]|uniref:Uncharacterized protein n=1 Tax=Leptospira weilii str. 2006001853 TaxID=1001589 RepID=A0A828Z0A3_9LEPT|nr:hypothetical protein LEP1GSC036_0916 [Leptospira weilii str. 2006001853]EMN45250.1 hypothetical protein LEP1GSC086_3679 [Leptospira weilii str. LNT 1234]